jgi:hypothetical protein
MGLVDCLMGLPPVLLIVVSQHNLNTGATLLASSHSMGDSYPDESCNTLNTTYRASGLVQ